MDPSNLAEELLLMEQPSPQEIGEMLYRIIADEVKKKNIIGSKRPNLSVYKQTDIHGEFRIVVDYQVDPNSIKDHFVVRIIVFSYEKRIGLFIRDEITPTYYALSKFREVKGLAKKAITEF